MTRNADPGGRGAVDPRFLFDGRFYAAKYPDVTDAPYEHYAAVGCLENRQPSPHFSPGWFGRRYPASRQRNVLSFMIEADTRIYPNRYWEEYGWSVAEMAASKALAGKIRPTVLLGLFGSGRNYLNNLVLKAKSLGPIFQDGLDSAGFYGEQPLICSGHATLNGPSDFQYPPSFSQRRLIEPLRDGYHQVLFILRHPVDSLLSNWAWWREYARTGKPHRKSVTALYPSNAALCADLERNFPAFLSFLRDGLIQPLAPVGAPVGRFLSFPEFLDETDRWIETDGVVTLRFEDFHEDTAHRIDVFNGLLCPSREFAVPVEKPMSPMFNYLAVLKEMPRLRDAIHDVMDGARRAALSRLGYEI